VKVKYRGSLASGFKHAGKLSATGSILPFNAPMPGQDKGEFDCDAFIELDDATWAEIAALGDFELNKASLDELRRWPPARALLGIQGEIARALGQIPGYKKRGAVGSFEFMVQGASKSAAQVHAGSRYPEGAIGQRYPAIENSLPARSDIGGTSRQWDEVHKEVL
jgi:hypothetical protein